MKKPIPFKKFIEIKENKGWKIVKVSNIIAINKKFVIFESHDGIWYQRTKETWKDTGILWEE